MENLKANLTEFIRRVNQYHKHTFLGLTISKTWNRGMGRLSLFRFYPDEKIVLINSAIFNNSDRKKLTQFCKDNHIEDWKWEEVYYGYPTYYNNSFGLRLLEK